jgi:succinate dehydrogenase flavin-adding protein (antitoxin of CptAB toxin-antitoxin module)
MKQKQKMSFEEHVRFGQLLKEVDHYLFKVLINASTKSDRTYKGGLKMLKLIMVFKSDMEEVLYKDHPKQANISVYYGENINQ